jgi:hypothetical protein
MTQDTPSSEAEPKYGGFSRFEIELEVCHATRILIAIPPPRYRASVALSVEFPFDCTNKPV